MKIIQIIVGNSGGMIGLSEEGDLYDLRYINGRLFRGDKREIEGDKNNQTK